MTLPFSGGAYYMRNYLYFLRANYSLTLTT